jgi:molecular chaperone GrpE (heat shock protein)
MISAVDNQHQQERLSWVSSLLTPYLAAVWSVNQNSGARSGDLKTAQTEKPEQWDNKIVKDLFALAKRVDQLEDEVSLKGAERDRVKAQLDILRQHHETEREEILKKQVGKAIFCS